VFGLEATERAGHVLAEQCHGSGGASYTASFGAPSIACSSYRPSDMQHIPELFETQRIREVPEVDCTSGGCLPAEKQGTPEGFCLIWDGDAAVAAGGRRGCHAARRTRFGGALRSPDGLRQHSGTCTACFVRENGCGRRRNVRGSTGQPRHGEGTRANAGRRAGGHYFGVLRVEGPAVPRVSLKWMTRAVSRCGNPHVRYGRIDRMEG
jgi:hypothetical protein